MSVWGFSYKTNLVRHKIRKDGGSGRAGRGFYFRNVTELVLFGVKGKNARTLKPGRTQVNFPATQKREHSRKPNEFYDIIRACSPGPSLELLRARNPALAGRPGATRRRPTTPTGTPTATTASAIADVMVGDVHPGGLFGPNGKTGGEEGT